MTQAYYVEKLLPYHIAATQQLRLQYTRGILQEDNDPSHGTRSGPKGAANRIREANWIETLKHPAQSPDLNPAEGIWNILKQRIRRRQYRNLEELTRVIWEEWEKISMDEIRARIKEMPRRCNQLVQTGGKAIKSELW